MTMKGWSSLLYVCLLLITADRSLARVGSDLRSKYQIKERQLETQIINADELEDFLLTFSLDSDPKLLSAFNLDLFRTDGNLLPESLETCATVFNEWLQPILSEQFKHDTVKLVETTINSQQGLTSQDQGEIDGSSLNLELAVTFRHEPSPKEDRVEDAVKIVMQDMSGYVEALVIRARELQHEELYDVTSATRSEPIGDNAGVVNDVQTTNDGDSGVEQPVVLTTALVGGVVLVAAAMLLASRMKKEKEAETDAVSSLRQVNVFADGEEDDIFSFEAALMDSPTTSKPGAELMSPESLDSIESTGSNEFLNVDLSTPTPNKNKKPRHLRSTSVKNTTPKQSNPIFGYFSGILNHTKRGERRTSQIQSNQVTMSPLYIFSEEEDVESISESGSQQYLGSSNSRSHSSESADGPSSPTHFEYNTMTLDELLVEKYSENNDIDYVSSVDTTPTKDESKRIQSRMKSPPANFDDAKSPPSCMLSPKPPLYRSPPAKTSTSQRTSAPGQVYLSTSPELQTGKNAQSHPGIARKNPIICSSRNQEKVDEGYEVTEEKSTGNHQERYQVQEEDVDYDAEESSQEGSEVFEESPDEEIIPDDGKKKPKGVSSRLSALANFLRGKSLSPRKFAKSEAKSENNVDDLSSPEPVSSPPQNEEWISPSSSQSSRSRREAVAPPQEVWNQALFSNKTASDDQAPRSTSGDHLQGPPISSTRKEDGALEWGLDKYAQRRYAKSPSPQRAKASSNYVMQPEPNPKRRIKSESPDRRASKNDRYSTHNQRTYQTNDEQLESAELYLSSEGEGQTSDSSGLVGELLQSSSSEQYGESDVSKSDQSSFMYNTSPQKPQQSGTSMDSLIGAAAMAASTFGWAMGAQSSKNQNHDHYSIPEAEDETSSSSVSAENDEEKDRKIQAKAKLSASEKNMKPTTMWTAKSYPSSYDASPRTSPRKSPRSPEQASHQRSLFAKRMRQSPETENIMAQDPPSTAQTSAQPRYGAPPTPNSSYHTRYLPSEPYSNHMRSAARPPMQRSSPPHQSPSQRYHARSPVLDGSNEYQEQAGSEPDSPPPVESPPREFDLQGDASSSYQRQSRKLANQKKPSPSISRHHSSPILLDGTTEYQTRAGSEPDSPPRVESPSAHLPSEQIRSPDLRASKMSQGNNVKSPSPSRRHATSPLVDGTNEYQEQVEAAVSEDSPERDYDYLPGERLHAPYYAADRNSARPSEKFQPDFSNRRHAMSSAVDGSTDYQATLQQRDGNTSSFEAVSLSDSDVPSPMDSATPQSLSTSNNTSDGGLGGMQFLSSGNSGSSSDALSTRHGRRLLDDLVWLEKKIAGVGGPLSPYSPSSSSFTGLSHSQSSSSSQALDEKIEIVLNRDDSLSFASVDGYVDSASENSVAGAKDEGPAIVCKDCYAPPGKLRIVIHSTKDGPAVHTVKEGSVLLGHLFPGDIIVAVDDADTRAFSAEQVMRIMTARTNQERKITVLRLQEEPPTPTKKRRMT